MLINETNYYDNLTGAALRQEAEPVSTRTTRVVAGGSQAIQQYVVERAVADAYRVNSARRFGIYADTGYTCDPRTPASAQLQGHYDAELQERRERFWGILLGFAFSVLCWCGIVWLVTGLYRVGMHN